jgi:F0F1-type ATP synthase membrane subunit b/b'
MLRKATILAAILVFLGATSVFATNNSATNSSRKSNLIEEKIQERQTRLEQLSVTKQVRMASIEAKVSQIKQNAIRKYYKNMSERINALIDRLNKLTLRIESRIAKIEESDTPVGQNVKDEIDKAKQLLSDTQTLLASSDGMLEDVLLSNQPKEAFSIIRENIKDIKTNLIEVHTILVHVIGEIQGLRVGNTQQLSPTPTTAPTISPESS